jgi:Immunoglobulin I-set domain/Protein of unknown function (DUF642)
MKHNPFTPLSKAKALAVLGAATAVLICQTTRAQTITNPSFEANTYTVAPGYISDNSPITGWTADNPSGAGLNPAGGTSQFADNGAIPDGKNVAFISGGTTLSTTITGLTAGKIYKLMFQANAPSNNLPVLRVSVNSQELLALTVYTAGGTGPYGYLALEFTATATSAKLGLFNDATSDQTLLVDNFTVALSSGKWVVSAWTGDADSGIDSQYVYTHAYSFGTTLNAVINGVAFTGVGGTNPSVSNKFSTVFLGNVFNNDANNITGDSAALAKDFIYSGANVSAGSFETITIEGLTPGTNYVATIYSCGFDDPSTTIRWATLSYGQDRLTFNQDQFGNNNGTHMSYSYTADTNGTAVLRVAPVNPVNVSIHMYGFSNREAVSRNIAPGITLQPASTTVAAGVPVDFTVASSGFPAPTYQWRFNAGNINGANTNKYSIASPTGQNAGLYDVIVANSLGKATSVVARLTVGLPMNNGSFEADSFISWPGYSGTNPGDATTPAGPNIPITGWTQSDVNGSGINPISDGASPFADNGTIPNGKQVAFIQSDQTLDQTVSGLTAGSQYYVHYYENGRSTVTIPAVEVQLGGKTLIAAHNVPPVGGSLPYREVYSDVFTATGTSVDLAFVKSSAAGGDNTLLLDNVAIVSVPAGTVPTIVADPQGIQLPVGKTNTFSVQFIGSVPATYQWLKNGNPISGATGATLTLSNVQSTDDADYSVKITNSAGSTTSAAAHLTVLTLVPGIFGTGVGADGNLLDAGATDTYYKMTTSPDTDFPGPDALVLNDAWPVAAGVWVFPEGPDSKWIAPQADQSTGNAPGDYVYETTFDLTGVDVSKVQLVGQWAVDNSGTDIVLNGKSTGFTSSGFNAFSPFTITTNLVAGKNTMDFKVNNAGTSANPTGIRVDLKGILTTAAPAEVKLQVGLKGSSVTISWPATPAGQKLQSATNIKGPWTEVTNASNPYTVTTTGAAMFFRTAR